MSFAAVAIAATVADHGKQLPVWPGHSTFPSGHESFGSAAGTCLIIYDRDWVWFVVPILVLFGWALVAAEYHDPVDIYGGAVVGPLSAFLVRYAVSLVGDRLRARNNTIG
jgi:membrane-associated phospholipid phosphatase